MEQKEIPMLKMAVIAQHFIAPHNDTDLSCHPQTPPTQVEDSSLCRIKHQSLVSQKKVPVY